MKPIHLVQGTVLYEPGDTIHRAYFLLSGIASLLSVTEDGLSLEVGMIGNEGIVGIPLILGFNKAPYEVMMQITADTLEIKADVLKREFNRSEGLRNLLLRYTHALLCQIAQLAVCNRFHTVEQQFCRWLLTSRDRVHSDTFHFTQEFISQMLGVPRTNITMTAGELQRKNLIRYTRGNVTITDHQGLEAASCECYRVMKEEIGGFLDA
ncbi:MAG: Crp/Fnr family transcriptional regulator [Pyrinomonadaceae bacterium]